MKQKLLLLFFGILTYCGVNSQQIQLSEFAEISVLTIGPGKTLNDAFGHSAFRIKDPMFKLDIVYNYGVYDFSAPNFYLKFAQGKLDYLIGLDTFNQFLRNYRYQDRTITEQKLNLTKPQKQELFNYLSTNHLPENRKYKYDFFYDNCATKIRDVINTSTLSSVQYNTPDGLQESTFRDLIYEHVNKNSWSSFGIDLALGSVVDKTTTSNEYMFLPKYIQVFFENATVNTTQPLVSSTKVLYTKKGKKNQSSFFISPLFIMGIISLIIILFTAKDFKSSKRTKWIDACIFVITGLIGIMLLLLWFATDHSATAQNYNLLWAFPLNLILIIAIAKRSTKKWQIGFLKFLVIMLCLMTFHWIFGVQVFAIALIPLIIALFIRYIFLIHYFKKHINN